MTRIQMELFTDQGNYAVVRLPDRKYPGVVIQGDSLSVLLESNVDAIDALGRGDYEEAKELLAETVEKLRAARQRYETALKESGIDLPS